MNVTTKHNLTPDNPAKYSRDYHIAALKASGMDSKTIAQQPGITVSDRRIRQILSDERCKAIVDKAIRTQIAHAPSLTKEHLRICYDRKHPKQLEAIVQVQKNIGIAKEHTGNIVLQQIFNTITIGALNPEALDYIKYLQAQGAGDVMAEQIHPTAESHNQTPGGDI